MGSQHFGTSAAVFSHKAERAGPIFYSCVVVGWVETSSLIFVLEEIRITLTLSVLPSCEAKRRRAILRLEDETEPQRFT